MSSNAAQHHNLDSEQHQQHNSMHRHDEHHHANMMEPYQVAMTGRAMAVATTAAGPCSMGLECTAPHEELSEEFKCQFCGRQLHGFTSACSKPRNEADFRDGVICKDQPCVAAIHPTPGGGDQHPMLTGNEGAMLDAQPPMIQNATAAAATFQPPDGVARSAAVGHPEFLWQTQRQKRTRDPSKPKPKRLRYTTKQKEAILGSYLLNPNAKLQDVAKAWSIPEGTLRSWYDENRRANPEGPPGDLAVADGDPILLQQASVPEEEDLPQKKRRNRYSNETKIQVILALETRPTASVKEVAKEFGVATGTARGWIEEADKIQKQAMENRRAGAKANPSKDPMRKIWDAILRLFELNSRLPVSEQLDLNVAVVKAIGLQARDILLSRSKSGKNFLTENELKSIEKFKASETWARKWSKDHQVISAKNVVNPLAAAHDRLDELQQIVDQYSSDYVYSMASTSLFYRLLPHQTFVTIIGGRPTRACKGLKSKDRLTLYISCNESGKDKLPVACIGKYENPACIQVYAQQILPYLNQKNALSDAGTFQRWWRSTFLPHIRSQYHHGEKILLLVDPDGPCNADLLKDPMGQVRVEALPNSPSPGHTQQIFGGGPVKDENPSSKREPPQCQPMAFGIVETIKRRYRYRLLQDIIDTYGERVPRRKIADDANYPLASRGLREGNMVNLCDAMRLLESIWSEITPGTIFRSWQRTKLRLKHVTPPDMEVKPGGRAKSDKRQTTREKKLLVEDLQSFLTNEEDRSLAEDASPPPLEEAVEKLKACFLYNDGTLIPQKEMFESLEDWIVMEESDAISHLIREEIRKEMNILYLTGLEDMPEAAIPEADEPEESELRESKVKANSTKGEELDYETAVELAGNIKATAVKLFGSGNILGDLAVKLDDATDAIFSLLRKQKASDDKEDAETKSSTKQPPKQHSFQEYAHGGNQLSATAPIDGSAPAPIDESDIADVKIGDVNECSGAVPV